MTTKCLSTEFSLLKTLLGTVTNIDEAHLGTLEAFRNFWRDIFGEYGEAKKYFVRALEIDPDNYVSKNYLDHIEKITKRIYLNKRINQSNLSKI